MMQIYFNIKEVQKLNYYQRKNKLFLKYIIQPHDSDSKIAANLHDTKYLDNIQHEKKV